jgi:hypothetical protein
MVGSKKKKKSKKIPVPWSLYMAIVRLQAVEELEFEAACEWAGSLLDEKSSKYTEAVQKEANLVHKKRFMKEMNKAKKTWIEQGRMAGFSNAESKFKIECSCAICGKPILLVPDSEMTKTAVKHLELFGWRHTKCDK